MKRTISFSSFLIIEGVSLVILLGNIYNWQNITLGRIAGLFFFGILSIPLGKFYFSHYNIFWRSLYGSLLIICEIIIGGTLLYYLSSLNKRSITILLVSLALSSTITAFFAEKRHSRHQQYVSKKSHRNFLIPVLVSCFLILEAIGFFILYKAQTVNALRTPWQVIGKEFFIIYFASTFLLLTIASTQKRHSLSLSLIVIHFLQTSTIALIVYKLGYGFDPFIHQATERIIAETGAVYPKRLYYIGQYVFVVLLSKIFFFPISLLDSWLVPVFFSFFVPLTIFFSFFHITEKLTALPTASLGLLLFPVSSFIITTPQSFANIFTILTIFFSLIAIVSRQKKWLVPITLLGGSSLLIHPLSGIPTLIFIFFVFLIIFPSPEKKHRFDFLQAILVLELSLLAAIAIPILFILNAKISGGDTPPINTEFFQKSLIQETVSFLTPEIINNYDILFDIVYWYEKNQYLLFILLAAGGGMLLIKKYRLYRMGIYAIAFIVFLIDYFFLRTLIVFPELIEYEQANYPLRLREIGFYFLLPFMLFAILFAFTKSKLRPPLLNGMVILLLSIWITSSLYLSYPRADAYHLDRGFNLTQTDINAVRYIHETAQGDYIVLANQVTSVAAIREFGFQTYYQDIHRPEKKYFYYPIPTGDPLYQYYLKMVYQRPTKSTALQAGKLVGVDQVYFVLNSYWDDFHRLVEEAKQEADDWQSIDQGKAYVFFFTQHPQKSQQEPSP